VQATERKHLSGPNRAADAAIARPTLEENHMLQIFVSIQNRLALLRDEQGQTMAEYGVVLAVIAVIVVAALTALSGGISGALTSVTGILNR